MANRAGAPAELEVTGGPAAVRGRYAIGLPPEPGLNVENVVADLQKALRKLLCDETIAVSGNIQDLVREISGRVGFDESRRRRPRPSWLRPERVPYVVEGDPQLQPVIDQLSKNVRNLWTWVVKATEETRDHHAIMLALRDVFGEREGTGGSDAVTD